MSMTMAQFAGQEILDDRQGFICALCNCRVETQPGREEEDTFEIPFYKPVCFDCFKTNEEYEKANPQ